MIQTGLVLENYEKWMYPYVKPLFDSPCVTTLKGTNIPRVEYSFDFKNYPLKQIVYHLSSPEKIIPLMIQHLEDIPNVKLYGFGKNENGKPYVMYHNELVDKIEKWKSIQKPINTVGTYMTPNGISLRDYQCRMVDFALEKKRCGLFIDMGLGKTLATLETLNQLFTNKQLDPRKPVLVVAPIMVALDTWSREAHKWGYDWDVLVNISLTKKKREALLDQTLDLKKPTLLTTNPEQLKQIKQYYDEKGIRQPFECIIVDELSMFKSAGTQRFNYMSQLTKTIPYFFGLTGTPSPNSLLDIWSQSVIIDEKLKKVLGYNYFTYRNKYFQPDMIGRDGTVFTWKPVPGAEEVIYNHLKSNVIAMKTDERIQLPDIVYVNEYIKLPDKARKIYNQWDIEVRKAIRDYGETSVNMTDTNMSIANSAILKSKLLQLSGGAVYDNLTVMSDEGKIDTGHYEVFHDEKLKRLKEMAETSTSPLLVFYQFRSDIERAEKYLDFVKLDPKANNIQEVISEWNKGNIPVLFVHPASAAHGLNLQDGGHTIVWLTPTWSNEQYRQANKRLHRSGQQNSVQIIHLIAEGTADEDVIMRIQEKETIQQNLLTALEDIEKEHNHEPRI